MNWQWTQDGAHTVEFTAGYPVYGSTANFTNDAVATVQIRRAELVKSLLIGGAEVTLSFNIPLEGIVDAMVNISNQNEVFPAEGDAPVTVTIDTKSRFFSRTEPGSQLLISCAGGIDTNSVRFTSTRKDAGTFRYGPPTKNGMPTELWLDVEAAPYGFKVIIR